MFKNFLEKYLNFNLKEATGIDLEVNKVILVIAIGFCIAAIFINLKQSKISAVLRGLIRKEAFSPDAAVSIKKLGLEKSGLARRLLQNREGFLKAVIRCREEDCASAEAPSDNKEGDGDKKEETGKDNQDNALPKTAKTVNHYYIPEDKRSEAKKQLEKNNGSVLKAILGSVLILAFAFGLILLIPVIL